MKRPQPQPFKSICDATLERSTTTICVYIHIVFFCFIKFNYIFVDDNNGHVLHTGNQSILLSTARARSSTRNRKTMRTTTTTTAAASASAAAAAAATTTATTTTTTATTTSTTTTTTTKELREVGQSDTHR